jgi:hypothetical protein
MGRVFSQGNYVVKKAKSKDNVPYRKIRLIEGNAKCRPLKNQRDFAAGVFLSEAQNPIPINPLTHCIRVHSTLIHTGNGGGGESCTREKEIRETVPKAGSKIPT